MSSKKATDYRAAYRAQREEMRQLDLRRQKQIKNQVDTINRLLSDPDTAQEIAQLHEALATAQQEREAAVDALAEMVRGMDDAIATRVV